MHEVRRDIRANGKGQAKPGPSLTSALAGSARTSLFSAAAWIVLVLAAAGRFVFETATVGHFEASVTAGTCAIASGLMVGAVYLPSTSNPSQSGPRWRSPSPWLAAVLAGISSAGVPWLVLANRYSDAPKGSLVLFWTAVAGGAALWVLGALEGRPRLPRASGVLLALVGAMGVLANWERPSSFSLLSRYTSQQLLMGAAAVVWAASISYLARRARSHGWGSVAAPFALGAVFPGIALLLISGRAGDALAMPVLLAAVSSALVTFLALTIASIDDDALASGAALVFVPIAVSSITFVESALGMRGPRPLLASAVLWSSAVCVAGLIVGMRQMRSLDQDAADMPRPRRIGVTAGAVAVVLACVSLVTPGVGVAVRGVREVGSFSADFNMMGIETVGGWLVLALAAVLLAAAVRPSRSRVWRTAVALAVGTAAWWTLRFVPLHTWISWIPPEVQQDYGTEYASIVFSPVAVWWQAGTLVVCFIGALALLWDLYGARRAR